MRHHDTNSMFRDGVRGGSQQKQTVSGKVVGFEMEASHTNMQCMIRERRLPNGSNSMVQSEEM